MLRRRFPIKDFSVHLGIPRTPTWTLGLTWICTCNLWREVDREDTNLWLFRRSLSCQQSGILSPRRQLVRAIGSSLATRRLEWLAMAKSISTTSRYENGSCLSSEVTPKRHASLSLVSPWYRYFSDKKKEKRKLFEGILGIKPLYVWLMCIFWNRGCKKYSWLAQSYISGNSKTSGKVEVVTGCLATGKTGH